MGSEATALIDLTQLRIAEDLIANAKTPQELAEAHAALKSAIRRKRVKTETTLGQLAETFKECMRLGQGMSASERNDVLEKALRAAWPTRREWKFICSTCRDTGWTFRVCRDGDRCDGRSTSSAGAGLPPSGTQRFCAVDTNYTHEYVSPCFCSKGQSKHANVQSSLHCRGGGDVSEAGKSRGMSRIGR